MVKLKVKTLSTHHLYFPMNQSQLFQKFKTSSQGLSTNQANERIKKFGLNKLKVQKAIPLWKHFIDEFTDLMVLILIFAAAIAYIGGEEKDAVVILVIVLVNATIGFIQKFRAEKAIEALKKLIAPTASVIRENQEIEIDAHYLVPGDILILREGDRITADAILIESNELKTQEATLTGESTPVLKNINYLNEKKVSLGDRNNEIFLGTLVAHGSGKAIVQQTGMQTEFGKIAKLTTETKKEQSPLQKELFRIGLFVGKVTFAISTILFIIGITLQGESISTAFLFATAVAVAAVPEGLPATITIALAMGVQRLAKKNSIVKQLASVETLGSTTVICSDKTGTLTRNEMTVTEMIFGNHQATISGVGYQPKGEITINSKAKTNNPDIQKSLNLIQQISQLCNNATLKKGEQNWEILGDPTEGALLTLAQKIENHLQISPNKFKKLGEIPFDSKRKRMTVVHQDSKSKEVTAFVKGAPDEMLKQCTHILIDNKVKKLTKVQKEKLLAETEKMAKKALRTIAMATKKLPKNIKPTDCHQPEIEEGLTFIGIVGMIDPPRKTVPEAVKSAQEAGINIYIITGDHGLTAEAIAKQVGIIGKRKHQIITGAQLNKLKDSELKKELRRKQDIIFARVNPEHKLRIVEILKQLNQVVAVTGDGVNDAPALKKADIGIAMGITGTDVSKEAANMILADDSFSTIVNAIREGRTIYQNLKKFVFYIFSCNIGELTTIFAAIILGIPAPLTAVLILAVDIGTDILPALALGIDPTKPEIMQEPPRDPKKKIMDFRFNSRFIYLGLTIGLVVISTYIYALFSYGWQWGQPLSNDNFIHIKGSTMAFANLVLIQMVNAFNSRSSRQSAFKIGFFSNKPLLGAICISIITVIAFVEVPFFQKWLHTTGLTFNEWMIISVSSLSIFIIEEIRKLIVRTNNSK